MQEEYPVEDLGAEGPHKKRGVLTRAALFLVKALIAVALPFFILLRGSAFLYLHYRLNVWLALAGGGVLTFLLLIIYLTVLDRKVFRRERTTRRSLKRKAGLAGMLLLVYFVYSLVSISGANVKTGAVKEEFTTLHPLLRIGVSTVLLVDRDLLITDLARTHADYGEMGLEAKRRSLHYPQEDGYVHALDLRTVGRSEVRNWLLKIYFKLIGFNTLRHVGTGDHLHVSIPAHR